MPHQVLIERLERALRLSDQREEAAPQPIRHDGRGQALNALLRHGDQGGIGGVLRRLMAILKVRRQSRLSPQGGLDSGEARRLDQSARRRDDLEALILHSDGHAAQIGEGGD